MFETFRRKSKVQEPVKEEQKQAQEPAQKQAQKEAQERAQLYVASELGVLRYGIEHRVLRDLFYTATEAFLARLMAEKGAYGFYDQYWQLSEASNPYSESDFSVKGGKIDDDHIMVSLDLPEPEYTPLCYRIHYICRNDFSAPAMFTIERGVTGGFLCGWNSKGDHLNFSELKDPAINEYPELMRALEAKIIFDLYKEKRDEIF